MIQRLQSLVPEMIEWRRHLHAHPETAFQEHRTARFIADTLASMGIEVHRGIGATGLVGTLRQGPADRKAGGKAIGLRTDMDGLPIAEENTFAHLSTRPGIMHACGHDGHMAMLLGAAAYLSREGRFEGTVQFIFQPAEENEGGAAAMIADGLFERFPCNAVFGMHNFPTIPFGTFALRSGPVMAAADTFSLFVRGTGGHAAMPHLAKDPLPAAAHLVIQLQGIVSRSVNPLDQAVVSVTRIEGGTSLNIIPTLVTVEGTTRHFEPSVQELVEARIGEIAAGISASQGVDIEVHYDRRYPAVINSVEETAIAAHAAAGVASGIQVVQDMNPTMGSEDFAFMLQKRPGAFIALGAGQPDEHRGLHQPRYDFNDDLLPLGAAYWVNLVEEYLR